VRFYLERTARAVLAKRAAGGIPLGSIPFRPLADDGPVDRTVAAASGVVPAAVVSPVAIAFHDVDRRGRDRAFTARVRTRLSGESETTTQEDDDTQIMVGV